MKIYLVPLAFLLNFSLLAQNLYQVDPSFRLDAVSAIAEPIVIKMQADGKFLVGGKFEIVEGSHLSHLIRLNPDGSIDETFNSLGSGPSDDVQDIEVLPSGKILIALRQGRYYNGSQVSSVVRLNQDGTIDDNFVVGPFLEDYFRFNNSAFALDVQEDGKIIVAGAFHKIGDSFLNGIARLNEDGSVDESFATGDGFRIASNPDVAAATSQVKLLSNGNIAVLGQFDAYDGMSANVFAVIGNNGEFQFTTSTILQSNVFKSLFETDGFILEQSDGKIIISRMRRFDHGIRLIRLNKDGTEDLTLENSIVNNTVLSLAKFSDDRLFIVSDQAFVTDKNGVIDNSVNFPNDLRNGFLADDNTIVFSTADEVGFTLKRFNATGQELEFKAPRFYSTAYVRKIMRESDSTFLFIGRVNPRQGANYSNKELLLGRITEKGIVDNDFSNDVDGNIRGMTIDSNGNIWIWGDLYLINGEVVSNIVKLNTDGSIDESFNVGAGFDGRVEEVRFQTDGKLIAVGLFEEYNETPAGNIIRLNQDGSLDDSYQVGSGFNGARPRGLELQGDGKAIVFDGNITEYDGIPAERIVRLNVDGTLDNTFSIGSGFDNPFIANGLQVSQNVLKILENGQILVGGEFDSFDDHQTRGLAKINPDGSVDPSFVANISQLENYFGTLRDIEVTKSGDLLICGFFEMVDGVISRGFARLDQNGRLLQDFNIGRDILAFGNDILVEEDTFYLAGQFKEVAGSPYAGLLRVVMSDLILTISDQRFSVEENSQNGTVIGTISASQGPGGVLNYTIDSGNELGVFNLHSLTGELTVNNTALVDFESQSSYNLTVSVNVIGTAVTATANVIIDIIDIDETIVGINNELTNKVLVYPNPAKEILRIPNWNDFTSYSIRNGTGKRLINRPGVTSQLQVSNLSPGVYILELTKTNNELTYIRFIKE